MLTIAALHLLAGLQLAVAPAEADDDVLFVAAAEEDDEEKTDEKKKSAKKKDDKKGEEEEEDDFGSDEPNLDVFKEGMEDEPGTEEPVQRIQDDDEKETRDEDKQESSEDDNYGGDESAPKLDFTDESDESVPIGGPGQDTARIYRDHVSKMEDLGPDEEIISWEQYLERYPNSLFKDRIQARVEELNEAVYDERLEGTEGFAGQRDAGQREIGLAVPMFIESIDPRQKIRAGFEWGFPTYLNLLVDYEHQLRRNWSAHAGIQERYTGFDFTLGTAYAPIKSARTNTIVTVIVDPHLNLNPTFAGLRPLVGVGQRFPVGKSVLDAQLQAGADLEFPMGDREFTVIWKGGLSLNLAVSDVFSFYLDSALHMKDLGWEDKGGFRFNTVGFGARFNLGKAAQYRLGVSAPYTANYWKYHYGSIRNDFLYFMDDGKNRMQ